MTGYRVDRFQIPIHFTDFLGNGGVQRGFIPLWWGFGGTPQIPFEGGGRQKDF